MKYWAYVNNEILGPFEKTKLLELPSFSPSLLVCPQTPVGEKTEDWKEAATYPELSALITPVSAGQAPSLAPAGGQAAELKSLTPSQVDPVPPVEHNNPGIDIAISHLSKPPSEAVTQEQAPRPQGTAGADPLTLSQIERKTAGLSAQGDGAVKAAPQVFNDTPFELSKPAEAPQTSFKDPVPDFSAANGQKSPDSINFSPSAPAADNPYGAAPAASPVPQANNAATGDMERKIEELAKSAATKQDLTIAMDTLRMKLDMMGEAVSSIKNSQFEREIMDKLANLENAVDGMKAGAGQPQAAAQTQASNSAKEVKIENDSDTVFGVQPSRRKAEPKTEPPAKTKNPEEMVDQGGKSSKAGAAIVKLCKVAFKGILTVVLLAAVLAGAVIGLKTSGIFDATRFIPFQLPFLAGPAQTPAAPPAPLAAAKPATSQAQQPQAAQGAAPAEQPKAEEKEPQIAPEIVYFIRNYKLRPNGASLEDTIYADAAKTGGASSGLSWKVRSTGKDTYEVKALVPSSGGQASYGYSVDYAAKQILPIDESGKTAFEAMIQENNVATKRAAPKSRGKAAARRQQAKAPAQHSKKAPAAAKGAPADEYEYVYEDDDGTGK